MLNARIFRKSRLILQVVLLLFIWMFSAASYAQAASCDAESYSRFKITYPLLSKCVKLKNSSNHSIFIINRTQGDGVLRLEVSEDLKPSLEKAIFIAALSDGQIFWRYISNRQDPSKLGLIISPWPKFNTYAGGVDLAFPVLSEQTGRSAFVTHLF